jgi:hypothetical protein
MGDPHPGTSSGFPHKNASKCLRQNGLGGKEETAVPPKIPPNAEGAPMRQCETAWSEESFPRLGSQGSGRSGDLLDPS